MHIIHCIHIQIICIIIHIHIIIIILFWSSTSTHSTVPTTRLGWPQQTSSSPTSVDTHCLPRAFVHTHNEGRGDAAVCRWILVLNRTQECLLVIGDTEVAERVICMHVDNNGNNSGNTSNYTPPNTHICTRTHPRLRHLRPTYLLPTVDGSFT